MAFVNHHSLRINRENSFNINPLKQFPKRKLTELEQLNNKMFESIKVRIQNLPEDDNDHQNFKKIVDQMRGHDTSILSNLTKEFIETRRKNFD
jgi:hypothetical protein